MIEKAVIDYLNDVLSVPAYGQKPDEDIPDAYVLVEKTSGTERDYILSAVIAVQSVAKTLPDAMALNEEVKAKMREMIALPDISRSRLNTDYNFTNPTRKEYRYQAVFELVYFE